MAYDDNNYKIAETNALGTATETRTLYGYDAQGHQTSLVNSLGRTNSMSYDSLGNLLTHSDPLGNISTNGYDPAGNLTTSVQFDAQGHIVAQSFSTYVNNQLVESRNASNQVTATFGYDGNGNLTSTTDANGFTRYFGYDANGNQTSSSHTWMPPGGGTSVSVTNYSDYDAAGHVVRVFDAQGNTNRTVYNDMGKPDYTVDKLGNTNSCLYDYRGNLIQNDLCRRND